MLKYRIVVVNYRYLEQIEYEFEQNCVVVVSKTIQNLLLLTDVSSHTLRRVLTRLSETYEASLFLFLSANDRFDKSHLRSEVLRLAKNGDGVGLLLPYIDPPTGERRIDGAVESFFLSPTIFNMKAFSLSNISRYIYELVNFYLNGNNQNGIEIVQVGKICSFCRQVRDRTRVYLENSTLQIAHKGSPNLLKRCLNFLNYSDDIPSTVEICFDDRSYKRISLKSFDNILTKFISYKNIPLSVGPFLARQYLVQQSTKKYIFLSDSDDISLAYRFRRQMRELQHRKLDIVGSHELRIDQIDKRIYVIRFPKDVNLALSIGAFHPLLHGTCVMSKEAFLKAGGYSTKRKFGYDSQFLLRAGFFLKIGNIDDFLYLRFRRNNSLTTAKKTAFGTNLRTFLTWRWRVDFQLIQSGKLKLIDSSLKVEKHNFDFKIERIVESV